MSTSATNNQHRGTFRRMVLPYCALSLGCAVVTEIYALFGHGVRSAAMDWMFLYPLLGGMLVSVFASLLSKSKRSRQWVRLGRNLANAGLATLTVGSMLRGILEIAGTASIYTGAFYAVGWGFCAAGAVAFNIPIRFHGYSQKSSPTRHTRRVS